MHQPSAANGVVSANSNLINDNGECVPLQKVGYNGIIGSFLADLDDSQMPAVVPEPPPKPVPVEVPPPCMMRSRWHACPELHKAMDGVTYIADHTRKEEDSTRVSNRLVFMCFLDRN